MVEACICSKNWFSSSREPVVVRQYMDEVQTFQDSIEVVPEDASTITSESLAEASQEDAAS
ncbi:hypothetical protein CsatB_023217 [Cannabis sativa]